MHSKPIMNSKPEYAPNTDLGGHVPETQTGGSPKPDGLSKTRGSGLRSYWVCLCLSTICTAYPPPPPCAACQQPTSTSAMCVQQPVPVGRVHAATPTSRRGSGDCRQLLLARCVGPYQAVGSGQWWHPRNVGKLDACVVDCMRANDRRGMAAVMQTSWFSSSFPFLFYCYYYTP